MNSPNYEKDLNMIKHDELWPHVILPVKRYSKEKFLEPGIISPNDKTKVYLANIFALSGMTDEEAKAIKILEYNSIEELLNDGWVVD